MYPELCIGGLFIAKGYPAPINSINNVLSTEIGYILPTKKKKIYSIWKDVFRKGHLVKELVCSELLTTEKNGSELNDPLSDLLMAWNSISFWSLVKKS